MDPLDFIVRILGVAEYFIVNNNTSVNLLYYSGQRVGKLNL